MKDEQYYYTKTLNAMYTLLTLIFDDIKEKLRIGSVII